jgi:type IV secretion system protein TrbF
MSELNEEPASYKPESAPETAYQRAKEEWDNRMGGLVIQKANWMKIAIALSFTSIILAAGLVFQSAKSSVVPYVVQVDKHGVVQAVGKATQTNYTPQQPVIGYFIAQFVRCTRSLPLDPVVAKQNWLEAYAFLSNEATIQLNEIAQREKPLDKLGQETVAVNIENVVAKSKDSYQVRWIETVYSKEGATTATRTMTGLFTIEIIPPTEEKQLMANPLGLYVKQFSWSKDV